MGAGRGDTSNSNFVYRTDSEAGRSYDIIAVTKIGDN